MGNSASEAVEHVPRDSKDHFVPPIYAAMRLQSVDGWLYDVVVMTLSPYCLRFESIFQQKNNDQRLVPRAVP